MSAIGEGYAGSEGMPGTGYGFLRVEIEEIRPGLYEATAHYEYGSNQGYLESHGEYDTRGRGDSPSAAIDVIRQDVLEWDIGLDVPERRSALRDAQYEADDVITSQTENA